MEAVEIPGLRLERELGRGAWSTVFAARQGDQRCAVKIARSTGSLARWFRREAAALARVTHPGVPRVLDVGEVRGRPYLVMELVEGQTLADRLTERRLEKHHVLELGIELADICVAIHAKGLVHRDIKPRNIVVTRGRTRLVDFGLVTHLDPAHASTTAAGTRSYGAPEQFEAPHLVDGRTDLFAVGRVLQECADQAGVSSAFRPIVDRLVAQAQDDRYATARRLLEDLERMREGDELLPFTAGVEPLSDQLPLVARRAELAELEEAWGEAQRGRGAAVLLEGSAGAGKTRLIEALRRSARGTVRLELYAEGHGQLPLASLRQMFDGYADHVERLPPAIQRERIRDLREAATGPTVGIMASITPRIAALLGVEHPPRETEQEPFVEAVADVLVKLVAASGVTLLVVDDFQWVDPVSREVFVRTAASAGRVQLAFVAAARAGARVSGPVARLIDAVGANALRGVQLRSFGEKEVAELTSAYLGTDANDPALIARVEALAEGTPLGAMEILHALLDAGALKPHWGAWQFDADMASSALLPKGATALLARRLLQVPVATRRVLEPAAILGSRFHPNRVAAVVGTTGADLKFALADATRSGLVEPRGDGQYRFVHESVRDAVIHSLTEREKRELHQRAAETLAAQPHLDRETLLSAANHSAAGHPSRDPELVHAVASRAAREAADHLDPETALPLFVLAEEAALRAGIPLDAAHFRAVGEAELRTGALDESRDAFERALSRAEGIERAAIFGRIAWVHQAKADAEGAWRALDQAFVTLGERLPTETPLSLLPTLRSSVRAGLDRRRRAPIADGERLRLETLCSLHYQNARLGVEYERPARTLASAVAILVLGERLGPSGTLARAYAICAVVLAFIGQRVMGERYLRRAREMAVEQKDPAALAQIEQHAYVMIGFAGDFDRALDAARRCVETYGHWIEVAEYCNVVMGARAIEATRGRTHKEWELLDLATRRVRRHGKTPAIFDQVGGAARLASAAMRGSTDDDEGGLGPGGELAQTPPGTSIHGYHRLLAWGPRATVLAAGRPTLAEIDALADAFAAEKINPRSAHPILLEYYVSIAHARVSTLRRESRSEGVRDLAPLDAAISDLRKAAKLPLFKAHLAVLEGERALLAGKLDVAKDAFLSGERLALDQTAPWVLSVAAVGLARVLLAEGRREAAIEKARIGANLAFENGAMPRFRAIVEEFRLALTHSPSTIQTSAASTRVHQLKTMLNVMHTQDREPRLGVDAGAVLDELLRILAADRGLLLFKRAKTRAIVGRTRRGEEFGVGEPQVTALLENVLERGKALTPSSTDPFDDLGPAIKHRWITSPLVLHDVTVGAVYVERAPKDPPFRRNAEDVLVVLGPQVAMTLELARILEEREVLQGNLQRAQRMEAVGQLASGIAHDFNNMLTAILASTEHLERANVDADYQVDLQIIREATRRAGDLTEKLLSFARRKLLSVDHLDLGDVVSELAPLLKRLLGEHIELFVTREPRRDGVKTDRTSFEQALINLAVNARDAMPNGGSLTIEVGQVELDEGWVARGAARAGPHVCVTITDTGSGMNADVQSRAFEPFFTTKRPGSGSGLGLASVYGFIKQSEGHIELKSAPGKGTVFNLYLPVAETPPDTASARETHRRQLNGKPATVLIVDDEPLVLQAVQRAMLHEGFDVHVASTGAAALDLARTIENLDIVITDVLMPSMSGPELARKLRENGCESPILFVSGHTHGELSERGVLLAGVEFMQKPFTERDLAKRVRGILMPAIEA